MAPSRASYILPHAKIPDPLLKMAIISDQSIPWRTRVIIVLHAKFDTYPMRKTIPAQENAGLVADDLSID